MRLMIVSCLILILSTNCFAQNAAHLNKGEPAPFEGDLLTLETTKQLYNDSLEKTALQKQLDLSQQNNQLEQQKGNLLLNQNLKLMDAATKDHSLNNWEKAGYFAAGIIVTGLAIKGVQALK